MEFSFFLCFKFTAGTLLACLSFAGWVLVLVNTSLLHDDCGTHDACDNFFRRYWWSILFQFGVMSGAFMLWVSGTASKARAALAGFLALVTVQHIELAGKLLTALDEKTGWPFNDDDENAEEWVDEDVVKGAISGFVILVFANMMYMLILGIGDDAGGRVTTATTGAAETPRKGEERPSEDVTPPV